MKLYGDVSQEHKDLAKELEEMEAYFDGALKKGHSVETIAKAFVCGAHDWYALAMEEEGNRLLEKADKICPCYFSTVMVKQQKEDKDFDMLVKNINHELNCLIKSKLEELKKVK